MKLENGVDQVERLKKIGVVVGSIEELREVVGKNNCDGNIGELHAVFPGSNIFCHHMKIDVPLELAPALTPFHTGRMKLNGHLVCQMDCSRACQTFPHMGNGFMSTIEPFMIGAGHGSPVRGEMIAAGKFVPAS